MLGNPGYLCHNALKWIFCQEVDKLLLDLKGVSVYYHKVAAVRDINIGVDEGTIVTLIGANCAGKTTTLRAICGLKQPTIGEIWFEGRRIDRLPPEKIN